MGEKFLDDMPVGDHVKLDEENACWGILLIIPRKVRFIGGMSGYPVLTKLLSLIDYLFIRHLELIGENVIKREPWPVSKIFSE